MMGREPTEPMEALNFEVAIAVYSARCVYICGLDWHGVFLCFLRRWQIRLSSAASVDLHLIVGLTVSNFIVDAGKLYLKLISAPGLSTKKVINNPRRDLRKIGKS